MNMCVCMYMCACMYMCVYVCVYAYISEHACICSVCLCVYMYLCACACMCIYVCMYVYVWICMNMSVYIYHSLFSDSQTILSIHTWTVIDMENGLHSGFDFEDFITWKNQQKRKRYNTLHTKNYIRIQNMKLE